MSRVAIGLFVFIIVLVTVGGLISESNRNSVAVACINQGMEWSNMMGGSCKAVEKKQ